MITDTNSVTTTRYISKKELEAICEAMNEEGWLPDWDASFRPHTCESCGQTIEDKEGKELRREIMGTIEEFLKAAHIIVQDYNV